METRADTSNSQRGDSKKFAIGMARAFAGAIIFSVPLLMTMEMWYLGFYMDPLRLALFLLIFMPLLVGLSHFSGFEATFRWKDDVIDAFVAYAVGFTTSAAILSLFAVIDWSMSVDEIIGKVSLQAVPASIGAMLSQTQFGGSREKQEEEERVQETGYAGEIFFMAVGALYLGLNLAPTEEMSLIAYMMSEWHAIALALVSLLIMHAFVYAVEFHGQATIPQGTPLWSVFLRFSVVGYAIALAVSAYVLWTFEMTSGSSLEQMVTSTVVLGFPATIGAAAARLIL